MPTASFIEGRVRGGLTEEDSAIPAEIAKLLDQKDFF